MFYRIFIFLGCAFAFLSASSDFSKLKTFQGEFNQIITSSTGKKIEYKGEVFIENTGKILWKYKTPIEKNVYIINNYVIIDEPELEQAIHTTLEDDINIIELLKNSKEINKNIYISKIDGVDYKIFTKEKDEKLLINNISYEDKLENKINILFSKVITNIEFDKSLFIFLAPEYYDVIRK